MEKSRFFNSVSGDRKYLAEDFASYFAGILTNGVFLHNATALQVSAYSGLTVRIATGKAYINGYAYENTGNVDKTLDAAIANRIDRIVVRLDMTARTITVQVKKGTAATTPVAPALTRTADVYELGIADIAITSGTTAITNAMITDLRSNSTYCGGVTMAVDRDEILGNITNTFAEFTQAASRANINTNESTPTVFGKIKKWFADLKALAFKDKIANADITDGSITNSKISTNAGIAQSKISGLEAALAGKLSATGNYPLLTAGNATRAASTSFSNTAWHNSNEIPEPSGTSNAGCYQIQIRNIAIPASEWGEQITLYADVDFGIVCYNDRAISTPYNQTELKSRDGGSYCTESLKMVLLPFENGDGAVYLKVYKASGETTTYDGKIYWREIL